MELWYNEERKEYLTVATEGGLKNAKTYNYKKIGVVGHILTGDPKAAPPGPPLFPGGGNGKRQPNEISAGKEVILEVLFVDWHDHQATDGNFDAMWNALTSNGALERAFKAQGVTIKTNLHRGWKRMPKTLTPAPVRADSPTPPPPPYFPAGPGWNWQDYTKDSIRLLGEGPDFPSNTIAVVVAPPSALDHFTAASGAHGGGYRGIRKMITIAPTAFQEHYTTLMHEIGHGFGAPDTYPMRPPLHHKIGAYDVMGDIVYATGFVGWTRCRNGWMGAERIKYLTISTGFSSLILQ